MSLVEKFLERLETSTEVREVEHVLADVAQVRGLTEDERAKVRSAAEARLEGLAEGGQDDPDEDSLDATIDEAGGQVLEELRAGAEGAGGKELTPAQVVVRDMAEKYDLPPGFILTFEDAESGRVTPYVTKPGLLYKLKQVGFRAVQVRFLVEDAEKGAYEAEAAIYPNLKREELDLLSKVLDKGDKALFRETLEELRRPTVARGTANPGNLKPKQTKWAKEMAETRAVCRAARLYTGAGLYLEEEVGA